jgi:hypothetical protein
VRLGTRRPKQPVTWIPAVLELFQHKGRLTSQELAKAAGKSLGGDAVTRCRQLGLPVEAAGLVNGSKPPRKLYTLDTRLLWLALEKALEQINRHALILNSIDHSADCRTYRNPAMWIEHVRRLEKLKPRLPAKRTKLKHGI